MLDISFPMPGAAVAQCVSVGNAYKSMGRRLLPDVCCCPVTRDASVNVCAEGDVLR